MRLQFIYYILLSLIVISCSASKKTSERETVNKKVVKKFVNEVKLDVGKNVSWVNLMPGAEPKFHVSGKITLIKNDNYNIETTHLKYIKIYQTGEELYFIMPKVIENFNGENNNITYSTIKGLNINKDLNTKIPVILELIFIDNKEELKYRVTNVMVEEVH